MLQPEEKPLEENDFWIKSEEAWVCRPCLHFANSKERPFKLNKFYKFNFEVLTISKQGDDSTKRSRKMKGKAVIPMSPRHCILGVRRCIRIIRKREIWSLREMKKELKKL